MHHLRDFDSFDRYIDELNQLILCNLQFLKAQLAIDSMSIALIKPQASFFGKLRSVKLMDSSIMVQYTILKRRNNSLASLVDDAESEDEDGGRFQMFKNFDSLREFLLKAGQVFNLLDNLNELNLKFSENVPVLRAEHQVRIQIQ